LPIINILSCELITSTSISVIISSISISILDFPNEAVLDPFAIMHLTLLDLSISFPVSFNNSFDMAQVAAPVSTIALISIPLIRMGVFIAIVISLSLS
jgi:hypothetical protein